MSYSAREFGVDGLRDFGLVLHFGSERVIRVVLRMINWHLFDLILVSLKASCSNGLTPVSCFLVVLYFTNIGILRFLLRSSGSPCCADALNLNLHFTKNKKKR